MAISLVVNNKLLQELSTRITVLIADDDSAPISNVRKNVSRHLEKWLDTLRRIQRANCIHWKYQHQSSNTLAEDSP